MFRNFLHDLRIRYKHETKLYGLSLSKTGSSQHVYKRVKRDNLFITHLRHIYFVHFIVEN
jgi:hypothetical protein